MTCELCTSPGGDVLWEDQFCRVVHVAEPGYPGFCRVIWNTHVREMTDLDDVQRRHCMNVVFAVERAMRNTMAPAKINLATLGNMGAHVHWHVIPRFTDDPHFPQPVWGVRQREGAPVRAGTSSLAQSIRSELQTH
jgi:hypothetical protein